MKYLVLISLMCSAVSPIYGGKVTKVRLTCEIREACSSQENPLICFIGSTKNGVDDRARFLTHPNEFEFLKEERLNGHTALSLVIASPYINQKEQSPLFAALREFGVTPTDKEREYITEQMYADNPEWFTFLLAAKRRTEEPGDGDNQALLPALPPDVCWEIWGQMHPH